MTVDQWIPVTTLTFTDNTVRAGVTYYYTIVAVDATGDSVASTQVSITTP